MKLLTRIKLGFLTVLLISGSWLVYGQEQGSSRELADDISQFTWLIGDWQVANGFLQLSVNLTPDGTGIQVVGFPQSKSVVLAWDEDSGTTTFAYTADGGNKENRKAHSQSVLKVSSSFSADGDLQWNFEVPINGQEIGFRLVRIDDDTCVISFDSQSWSYSLYRSGFHTGKQSQKSQLIDPERTLEVPNGDRISISESGNILRVYTPPFSFGMKGGKAWYADLGSINSALTPIDATGLNHNAGLRRHIRFEPISNLGLARGAYIWDRWHIEWSREVARRPPFKLVDCNPSAPIREFLLPSEYVDLQTDLSGKFLAGIFETQKGTFRLHLWKLEGGFDPDKFMELGEVLAHPFHFCIGKGLVALTPGGIAHWDLDFPAAAPRMLDSHGAKLQLLSRLRASRNLRPQPGAVRYIAWGAEEQGYWISDFPRNPNHPTGWKLPGDPLAFDGERLVYIREQSCWTARLEGGRFINHALIPNALSHANELSFDAQFLGDSGQAIVKTRGTKVHYRGKSRSTSIAGTESCLINFHESITEPLLVQSSHHHGVAQYHRTYTFLASNGTRGRWLLGISKLNAKLWQIGPNFSEKGTLVSSLDSWPRYALLIEDRWVIAVTKHGSVYALDLEAKARPDFVKFYSITAVEKKFELVGGNGRIGIRNGNIVLIWNTSQLENQLAGNSSQD